jgi:putative membrane protein
LSHPLHRSGANLTLPANRHLKPTEIKDPMKKTFTIIGPAAVAIASLCLLQPVVAAEKTKSSDTGNGKGSLSAADKRFVENAAKGGMMEVSMGKVAAQRAQNSEVKQFGSRMVADHSKANNELKSIASKKGMTLPAEPSAHSFSTDAAYMSMMVQDHQKDLAEFQQEAKNGSDPDLKKFADKTSKIVAEHLSQARRINKDLKGKTSNLTR